MMGYPITYGDSLKEVNSFTSEMLITEISDYCSDEKNQRNFKKGYKLGVLVFGICGLCFASRPAFASNSEILPDNSGTGGVGSSPSPKTGSIPSGTPAPEPGNSGSLARVPSSERGAYTASALGICTVAMKSGAYWIGFICAAAVIVGVRMAGVPVSDDRNSRN